MRQWVKAAVAVSAWAASLGTGSSARADTAVTTEPPIVAQRPVAEHEVITSGPNVSLITSGVITLGVPYVASMVVASGSDHDGDRNLYVPVVGPWADLANRGQCDAAGETSCATEIGYKALLIADGVLQTVGAIEIVLGFAIPEQHITAVVAQSPQVNVAPTAMGRGGYGLAAIGRF